VKTLRATARSVAISPDALTIASGSTHDVRLWDVRRGTCRHTIYTTPTPDGVTCLNFLSTVPGRLVSISGSLVQQWDINGSETGPTTPGHHIAFSLDGTRFVSCDKGLPTVRDTFSGIIAATLHSPGRDFSRCCFSPNDEFVAGAADVTVYVWNVTGTPRLIKTFIPDSSSISSLVYSSSLISMHSDGKIRFQRIDGDSPGSTTRNQKPTKPSQAKIIYATLQAEEGIAVSVDSTGTIERWDLSTGLPMIILRIPRVKDVGGVRLADDKFTIVHRGDSIRYRYWHASTWDLKAGRRLQIVPLSGDLVIVDPTLKYSIFGISKDGTTFFAMNPNTFQTWSTFTGECTKSDTLFFPTPASVSFDGARIQVDVPARSEDGGSKTHTLYLGSTFPYRGSNGPRLACVWGDDPVWGGDGWYGGGMVWGEGKTWGYTWPRRIIDITSQTEVFRLSGRFALRGNAVWDGRYLFAVYETGDLLILDFVHTPFCRHL
jgi:hypothetical protein